MQFLWCKQRGYVPVLSPQTHPRIFDWKMVDVIIRGRNKTRISWVIIPILKGLFCFLRGLGISLHKKPHEWHPKMFTHNLVYLSIDLYNVSIIFIHTSPSVHPPTQPPTYPSIHQSFHLSIHSSINPPIHLSKSIN